MAAHSILSYVLRCGCIVFCSTMALWCQGTARIAGAVTDPSSAPISGAAVALTETETQQTWRTTSSTDGAYVFLDIPPGQFRIEATVQGFKAYSHSGITVEVGHAVTVDIPMELGSLSESVKVTGEASLVNTQTSTLQQTVDTQRMTELPLNGRNVLQLQTLLPGVVAGGTTGQFGQSNTIYVVNGARRGMTNYELDGGSNINSFWNVPNDYPNPDALQEFTMKQHSFSAVYGRNAGAVVEAVTRSGTNEFHGTLFEFLRNDKLDARQFFSAQRSPFKRNQYGLTVGGPIKRNHAFFFFSWQGTKQRGTPNNLSYVTMTPAEQGGNFSALNQPIIDPTTNTQFPDNKIPADRLSPVTQVFLQRFPLPIANGPGGLYTYPANNSVDSNQYIARIDTDLTASDRLMARVFFNNAPQVSNWGTPLNSSWFPSYPTKQFSYTASWIHTFSPTVLNEAQLTYAGGYIDLKPAFAADWKELGANINRSSAVAPELILSVSGYFAPDTGPATRDRLPTTEFREKLSLVRGRHSVQTGIQIYRNRVNEEQDSLTEGNPSFTGTFTGSAAADFILGDMANFTQYSTLAARLRQTLYSLYIQDDIKVSSHFALNAGLRWDPYTMYHSQNGQLSTFIPGQQSQRFPNTLPGLLYPGDPGVSSTIARPDLKNFAPRLGFAWNPFGDAKTSIRGSYGIFYDPIDRGIDLNRFTLIPPFQTQVTLFQTNIQNPWLVPPYNGANPFPPPPASNDAGLRGVPVPQGAGASSLPQDFPTPYAQQWDLSIQREIFPDYLLTVGYVGTKGTHLYQSTNANPSVYLPGQSTYANTQQRRIYPWIGRVEEEVTNSNSNYNSLQISLEKRFSRTFTVLSNYTFSKTLGQVVSSENEGGNGPRDPNNGHLDYGRLPYDIRHNWVTSFVWQVPTGALPHGFAYQILGGWSLTGILSLHSGSPFGILSGRDNSFTGIGRDTADQIGDWRLSGSRSKASEIAQYFNTAAFTVNAVGTYGTSGMDIIDGPGFSNLDAGLYKKFPISETKNFQFRFESFNLLNHANLNNPDSTVTDGTYGRILGASDPRVLEVALKFVF